MPRKITIEGEEGEQEFYTPDELEVARQEAINKYKEENPETGTEEIEKLQQNLENAKSELEKLKDKDLNFSKLREKVDTLEKQIDDKVNQGIQAKTIEDSIKILAGEDEEVEKKIKYTFETTLAAVQPKTPEELNKKLQDAYLIATSGVGPKIPMGSVLGSGGASFIPPQKGSGGELKPEVKNVANKLRISNEDIKKYDKQDYSTTK